MCMSTIIPRTELTSPRPFEENVICRLAALEEHIINLIVPIQNVVHLFKSPEIRDMLREVDGLRKVVHETAKISAYEIREATKQTLEHLQHLDLAQTFNEIKYIGNRLKEIEESIKNIQKDGVKRKILCQINAEGFDEEIELTKENKYDSEKDEILNALLNTLDPREKTCVIMRLGLFTHPKSSYKSIGKFMSISSTRVSQIYGKAITKLRHTSRRKLFLKLDRKKFSEFIQLTKENQAL